MDSIRVTSENGYDETFTTDKNGEIFIEGIRLGTYTISEIANVTVDATLVVEMHNVLRETPKTGDTRMPGFWLASIIVFDAGAVASGYIAYKKKKFNQ